MHRLIVLILICTLTQTVPAAAQPLSASDMVFDFALPTHRIQSLSFFEVYASAELAIEAQIMEGLMRFDREAGDRPVSNIAREYYVIDPLTYVFRLRSDVLFHPSGNDISQTVKAEDVRFSLDLARRSTSPLASRLQDIKSIDVVGMDLVQIKLIQPNRHLLAILATSIAHITSKAYYLSLGDDEENRRTAFSRAPIGTGPYLLREPLGEDARQVVIDRFEGYRDQEWARSSTALQTIRFVLEPDATKITGAILAGGVEMAHLPLTAYADSDDFSGWGNRIAVLKPPFLVLLAINTRKIKDPKMRQVLNAAVEKAALEEICPSVREIGDLPAGFRYYMEIPLAHLKAKDTDPLRTLRSDPDVEEDIVRLRAAGPLRLLISNRADHISRQIVDSIVANLKHHLELEVAIEEGPSVNREAVEDGKYDLAYVEWTPDTPWEQDDLSILETLFSIDSDVNRSLYSDMEVEKAFGKIRRLRDEAEIKRQYEIVRNHLLEDAPLIWLPSVRHRTLILAEGYRAPFLGSLDQAAQASTLSLYTSFMKDVRRQP